MNYIKLVFVLFLLATLNILNGQQLLEETSKLSYRPRDFMTFGLGVQMSGYRQEDFIKSNYSPLVDISIGRWFSPELAIQLGYKGWYFNTISNSDKRHYAYFYGEAVFNINEIIKTLSNPKWNVNLHLGSGYFYNYYYGRPNICADLGLSFHYNLSSKLSSYLNISSVMGWDIYQNDEDILLGSRIGLTYSF